MGHAGGRCKASASRRAATFEAAKRLAADRGLPGRPAGTRPLPVAAAASQLWAQEACIARTADMPAPPRARQGIVHPATIVSCITLLLAPLVNWLLIFKLRLGLDGAALAMNACQLSNLGAPRCLRVPRLHARR